MLPDGENRAAITKLDRYNRAKLGTKSSQASKRDSHKPLQASQNDSRAKVMERAPFLLVLAGCFRKVRLISWSFLCLLVAAVPILLLDSHLNHQSLRHSNRYAIARSQSVFQFTTRIRPVIRQSPEPFCGATAEYLATSCDLDLFFRYKYLIYSFVGRGN